MNRGLHLLVPLSLAVALAGCKTNPSGRTPIEPPPADPAKPRERSGRDAPKPPTLIDPENVAITGAVLMSNTEYETSIPLKIEFSAKAAGAGPQSDFDVLVGPVPNRGNDAVWRIANPDFEVVVGEGFAYLSGTRPHGSTGKGSVTSDGTWIIMQTNTGFDRFFLLHAPPGKKMTVTALLGAAQTKDVTAHLHYVDVRADGSVSDPDPIPVDTTDPVYVFVDEVIRQGAHAGIDEPPNWPPGTF
ncbi:MAG: hypothetical protein ACYTGP_08430 [Planctomycetota bacterium]|jgi:hypothetical protein